MSWEDQGRQFHTWFGHGTAPLADKPSEDGADALFDRSDSGPRIAAIAHAALAHMSPADRRRNAAAFDPQRLESLRKAMTAWIGARSLSDAAFAARLIDPAIGSAAIGKLRAAAEGAQTATNHQDLAEASADLAGAMQDIGLTRWPAFLSDAADRAGAYGSSGKNILLAQAATPAKATDANPSSVPAAQTSQELADFRRCFDAATAAAYQKYSDDCSHYLQTFLKNMGFPDMPYRTANKFMEFVRQEGSGWKQVTAQDAVQLSAEGRIVVAGLNQAGDSGHVAVVGPQMIPATLAGGHPMSPQVFSGASSSWAGARSQGEHSVADGWNRPDAKNVTYWVKQ